jgi:hypothetical protein
MFLFGVDWLVRIGSPELIVPLQQALGEDKPTSANRKSAGGRHG